MNFHSRVMRSGRALQRVCVRLFAPALLVVVASFPAPAQDRDAAAPEKAKALSPLVVVNVAGVEKLVGGANSVLSMAGRPDLSDSLNEFLGRAGDLKGVDRKRSFGLMLCLNESNLIRPFVITYVPIDDLEALMDTIGMAPVDIRKADGRDDRYEIETRGPTFFVQKKDRYALVCDNAEALDQELPDPGPYGEALNARFDVAVTARIGDVPETIRTVFLTYLRVSAETELQQRDNENESQYRIRRANGISNLELIEQVISQGEQITLGWDADAETQQALLEFSVDARPDSELAKSLESLSGRRSQLHAWMGEKQPLAVNVAWELNKREKKAAAEWVKVIETEVRRGLGFDENPSPQDAVGKLAASMQATVDAGKVDFGLQYVPLSGGKYVLVGAFHVVGTETLASGLQEVLQEVSDRPGLESVQLSAAEHQGIVFHKLVGRRFSPQDTQLYGGRPEVRVGVGQRMIWFAVGGDDAQRVLNESIDLVLDTRDQPLENASAMAPIQASMHLSPWLRLDPGPAIDESGDVPAEVDPADGTPPGAPNFRLEAARQAFDETNDRVQLEVQPTETGLRVRLRLDQGALRFMGMLMARRIDRTQL
jgi:hypothetical protein